MSSKVLLVLCDGMRPDAIEKVDHPFFRTLQARGWSDMAASTVMPSVTLPCHMSLFHSVTPQRHGILSNTYTPLARPLDGLFEVLRHAGLKSAFFYNWEPLRDLGRPGSLYHSYYANQGQYAGNEEAEAILKRVLDPSHPAYRKAAGQVASNEAIVQDAALCLTQQPIDFAFLYLGLPDSVGHEIGWMSHEYLLSVGYCFDKIQSLYEALEKASPGEYTLIVTADHGGHDQMHGTEMPEDMQIPLLMLGPGIPHLSQHGGASILDIAPTVCTLLGARPAEEWIGKSLL